MSKLKLEDEQPPATVEDEATRAAQPIASGQAKRRMLNDRSAYPIPQSMPGPDEMSRGWHQLDGDGPAPSSCLSDASPLYLPCPSNSGSQPEATSYGSSAPPESHPSHSSEQPGGKVLLLRNLPQQLVEADVEAFVSPFVRTSPPKIYLQFATGQAFVELGTVQEAQEAYRFFKAHPTSLKGNLVQVFFSDRAAVTTPDDKNAKYKVLLATVTNLMYPIDIELLRFLFSRFGSVQKIISFSKSNANFQALIQMEDSTQAHEALTALHSRNIYDGCNTLQIQPSRLAELTVRANNNRAWDYTVAPDGVPQNFLADDSSLQENHSPLANGETPGTSRYSSPGFQKVLSLPRLPKEVREWKHSLQNMPGQPSSVVIVYNLTVDEVTVSELFNVFSLFGHLQRIKILRDKPHTALLQYSDPVFASLAAYFMQGAALFDEDPGLQIGFSRNAEVKLSTNPSPNNDKRTKAFQVHEQRYGPQEIEKFVRSVCTPTKTLFIANLRDDCNELLLQKVVARHGRIVRVQVRTPVDGPRRKYILIEMSSATEALKALAHLHNTVVADSLIKVAFSKLLISDSDPSSSTSSAGGGELCRLPADEPTATSTASH